MTGRRWSPAGVTTLVVTIAVLGPLYVQGGTALRGDMVFAGDQPWKPAWLGLDGSVPRAVPMDALLSVVDEVVPGALLQRLLLTVAFLAGGFGIARLVRRFHPVGQVAAVLVYLWNPWVDERLAIGQWAAVLGYGLLPWLLLAAGRLRDRREHGWPATALLLVLSALCAPSVGLVAALVAVVVVAVGRRGSTTLGVVGLSAVSNLPWILPGIFGPGLHASHSQFGAFAARGESSLGVVASALSMGGIWKTSVVPPERTHVVVVAVAALLSLAFLAGLRYAGQGIGRRAVVGVVATGIAAMSLAVLPAIGPVGRGLGALSTTVPAVGVLRDSQRFLAPFGLVLAIGGAALVDHLVRGRTADTGRAATAALLVAAPVVLLPSLVWGLAGGLRPVTYPDDWASVAAHVSRGGGATVVLPWTGSYRGFAWNDDRAVLDPAPRVLPGDVLVDDRIFLRDRVLPGEDPFLARAGAALRGPDPAAALRRLGVRWVLVEKDNGVRPGDVPPATVALDGRWLTLLDLGPSGQDLGHLRHAAPAGIVVCGDVATGLVGCVSVLQLRRLLARTRR